MKTLFEKMQLVFFLLPFFISSLDANTITVPSGGDIQAAINAVSVGGTVKIEAGTYPLPQQIVINKNLNLVGAGMDMTIIQSPNSANLTNTISYTGATARVYTPVIIVENSAAVSVKHLTVNGMNQSVFGVTQHFTGIGYHNSGGVISDVQVINILESTEPTGYQEGTAILAANDDGTNVLSISDASISYFQKQGILLLGAGLTVTCRDNSIIGTNVEANPNGIELYDGATGVITGNTVTNLSNPASHACSGILIFNASNVKVENNQIMANDNGIYLIDSNNSIIKNNNLQNNTAGITLDETDSTVVNSYTLHSNVISNDSSSASTTGLILISPQTIDLICPLVEAVNNTINNSTVGLYVLGSPDGLAGPQVHFHEDAFLGFSQYYIQLVLSPIDMWPTTKSVSFNGIKWSNMTSEQFDELVLDPDTQQIIDKNTNSQLGLVLEARS